MCQIRVNLRRWACLLAALACLLALLPLPAHAAGAASKVVRVGWYEDAYNITGKNGERSGYSYEYEQSVAAYTGWTYEYVKAGGGYAQVVPMEDINLPGLRYGVNQRLLPAPIRCW